MRTNLREFIEEKFVWEVLTVTEVEIFNRKTGETTKHENLTQHLEVGMMINDVLEVKAVYPMQYQIIGARAGMDEDGDFEVELTLEGTSFRPVFNLHSKFNISSYED